MINTCLGNLKNENNNNYCKTIKKNIFLERLKLAVQIVLFSLRGLTILFR